MMDGDNRRDHGDQAASAEEVQGLIKWFDAVKGYGFIVPHDGGSDVLLHFSVLREVGRRSVPEGTTVKCLAIQRPKGRQATHIVTLDRIFSCIWRRCAGRASPISPPANGSRCASAKASAARWWRKSSCLKNSSR